MDYNRMDKATLIQVMLQKITELERDGMVDENFRECYSLKEHSIRPVFFLDLITLFLLDAKNAVKRMAKTLEPPVVDYRELYLQCIKLKGSALCLGVCPIRDACITFCDATKTESKAECLQALQIIHREHGNVYSRMAIIMKIEQEIISR